MAKTKTKRKEEEEAKKKQKKQQQQKQQDTNHTKFAVSSLLSAGTVRDFDVSSVVVTVSGQEGREEIMGTQFRSKTSGQEGGESCLAVLGLALEGESCFSVCLS